MRALHIARLVAAMGVLVYCQALLAREIGWGSPWVVLLSMSYLLALAKLAEPLWMPSMPGALARVDAVLRHEGLYRRLGVHAFGVLLRHSPLRLLNTSVYLPHGRRDLRALARLAESAEAAHFWAALLLAPYIGYAFWRGWWRTGLVLIVVQVSVNLYPILHLRLARARLARAQAKRDSRSATSRDAG